MFYDEALNVAVYPTAHPKVVLEHFPDGRALPDSHVGIPCTLSNLQKLTRVGMPTIAPMDYGYSWPHGPQIERPHHAQRVMANFMALNPRCFNLSEMRTGKTLSALWAADYLMEQHERRGKKFRALIIAPLRTLKRTWANSVFQHFLGKRTCIVLHGTAEKRLELLKQEADFYIINFDGLGTGAETNRSVVLKGMAKELSEREDIKLVVVDEASAYKDPSTRRHKVARALIQQRPYLWMMTGTPTSNGPLDAYGQAKLVNNAYGETLTGYKQRIMMQITNFKWVPRSGAAEAAKKLLSPSVRFTQDDCFDAPPCVVMQEDAELSAAQKKAYEQMKRELRMQMGTGTPITAVNEGVLRWKLIQIACGAIYNSDHDVHLIDAKPRFEVLREVMEEAPRKIIVFAPLTSVITLLYKELSKTYTCVMVNGEVPSKEADQRIADFQEGVPRVLIAHPGPIARGLDLTAAATIIWFAPTDKTEDYIQANQRINGPRQTHKRTIVQIAASPIEREIYKRLESNETMQGLVLKLAEE